jgi:hypothetical protein
MINSKGAITHHCLQCSHLAPCRFRLTFKQKNKKTKKTKKVNDIDKALSWGGSQKCPPTTSQIFLVSWRHRVTRQHHAIDSRHTTCIRGTRHTTEHVAHTTRNASYAVTSEHWARIKALGGIQEDPLGGIQED